MGINGHRKGNKGERLAAKGITDWSSFDHRKVPRSGGLGWRTSTTSGDITCIKEGHYSPFCFEIKNYAKIDFSHCLMDWNKRVQVRDWWLQAKGDAEPVNKVPILMCRQNGMPKGVYFTGMPTKFYLKIKGLLPKEHLYMTIKLAGQKVTFITSIELFRTDYNTIRKLAKSYAKIRS